MMTGWSTGCLLAKRKLSKYAMGSAIPAANSTKKKKNSQRGPRVGKVNKVTSANPQPPSKMRMRKAGRKSLKEAVVLGGVSMDEIISYFASDGIYMKV